MCGRFSQLLTWQETNDLFDLPDDAVPLNMQPRVNGAPTQDFVACTSTGPSLRSIRKFRWGLVPSWARDKRISARMINARSETVADKPSFRTAFRHRRCLVPANGWFEWKRVRDGKQPYYILAEDDRPMSFAGIWECWAGEDETLETFSILTRGAIPELEQIHHRQPVVVNRPDFNTWLAPDTSRHDLDDIIEATPPAFITRPVSKLVNNARNNQPEIHLDVSSQ